MLTAFMPEWHDESARWVDAVIKVAAAASDDNRAQITGWFKTYADLAQAALAPVAELALGAQGGVALAAVRTALDGRARKSGLAL
jgi:phenol hydroxylase P1 protein